MPTDVIMPQMGESIFEGTITKWLKKPGETVQRDEPLFEISTDKVDAEIPSPAAGVLSEIKIAEGTTVQINTVVGVIAESGAAAAPTPTAPQAVPKAEAEAEAPAAPAPSQPAAGHGTDGPGTDIVMPQMGESIFEGTITKWLKQVGDSVQRDEPLFEISTDKVDAEIPSPAAGVLSEIKVPAGTTVQINTVVGVIGGTAGASAAPAAPAPAPTKAEPPAAVPQEPAASVGENVRSSPLVRKIAKDNNLDLTQVSGTGAGGRITKTDVTSFLEKHSAGTGAPVAAPAPQPAAVSAKPAIPAAPTTPALPGELVPLSRMRSIIAQRMVDSKHTNAHVHTVFKIDFTRIVKMREKEKSKYEQRNGVKLTYMPFISRAVIATLRKMPIVNASMEGDAIRYHKKHQPRHCRRTRLGFDRPGHQAGRGTQLRGSGQGHCRSGRARAREEAEAGRGGIWHIHDYKSGNLRRAVRNADHQSAGERHSWRRRALQGACGHHR